MYERLLSGGDIQTMCPDYTKHTLEIPTNLQNFMSPRTKNFYQKKSYVLMELFPPIKERAETGRILYYEC